MVVSVGGKVQVIPVLVGVREVSESKPTDDASIIPKCRQNQRHSIPLGEACRPSDYRVGGDRRKGGMNLTQAFRRNCRNQSFQCKGRKHKWLQPRGEAYRCGALGRNDPYER